MDKTLRYGSLLLLLTACAAQRTPATPRSSGPAAGAASRSEAPSARVVQGSAIEPIAQLLPPMPEGLTSFGAASDGRSLYTLGGYHGTPHAYSREGQQRGLFRAPLDGNSGWEEISRMDGGLQGLALVHHAGKVCRVGGTEARNAAGAPADLHSVSEVSCYDLASGQWSALPALPAGRSSHDVAVLDNVLYVVGGWTLNGAPGSGTWQSEVLTLDLGAKDAGWKAIAAPFKRRALGVAVTQGKLVVIGGLTPEGKVSSKVDVYDPKTRSWSAGPDFPSDAFGIATVGVRNAVVASGRDGVVQRWQPGSAGWQPVTRLSFGRFFHRLIAASDDEVIAVGGISGMHDEGRTRHVERVPLNATGPRVVAWSMAYPGQAKNRQGVFVHGDDVYLFGGNNSLEQHDFEPQNFVAEAWKLHLPSMRMTAVAPFPAHRQTMQTVSQENAGIALGGFGHDGTKAISHADGYQFDFESEQWAHGIDLPESRTQFGLVQHASELWVFGGLDYDPTRKDRDAFQHVTSVLKARPGQDKVFTSAGLDLPGPRRAFASAALGEELFIVGGMRGDFELVEDCLRFDFQTRAFAPLACPGQPRLSGTMLALRDKLYLVGGSVRGEGGMVSAQDILELDAAAQSWREVVRAPFETRHMHALAFQDRILLISTHNADGRIFIGLLDPQPTATSAQPAPQSLATSNK